MQGSGMSFLMTQLGYQFPALLVYCIAFVLGLAYVGRAPLASILTLVGAGITVMTMIATAVAQSYLIGNQMGGPGMSLMTTVGITSSIVRAIGQSLLVAAIFVGRSPRGGSAA